LKYSMIFARGVYLHKVLCFQVCSFDVCVFLQLSFCCHTSFRVMF
jgi:hypothetical protein